jgi:hypothetical protein
MPNTPKVLFRGAATTTTTTLLYTVPSATTTIVTDILVANTSNSSGTYTLSLDGTIIANGVTISSQDSTVISIKQVLATTKTITGGASAATVNFSISGVEIS